MRTIVIQSHRAPLPLPWLSLCIDSVRAWSRERGYDYRWLGDELLDRVPKTLREKTCAHLPMTADLGRLAVLQEALDEGYQRAVWIDADVLVFAPERLHLDIDDHAFGREVWIQSDPQSGTSNGSALRSIRKIHNAFMCFTQASPVLPFYASTAQRLLQRHQGPALAPQFVGPKLLTALHNVAQFNVLETAAMLPPLVARSIVEQDSARNAEAAHYPALQLFQQRSVVRPAAVNLCASLTGELQALAVELPRLIDQLLLTDMPWPGISQD